MIYHYLFLQRLGERYIFSSKNIRSQRIAFVHCAPQQLVTERTSLKRFALDRKSFVLVEAWGPFFESPGNLPGPISIFLIIEFSASDNPLLAF